MYKIPDKYYQRLHQVRPRFKNDIENVLLYVASEISKLGSQQIDTFNQNLFNSFFAHNYYRRFQLILKLRDIILKLKEI